MLNRPDKWTYHAWERFHERYDPVLFTQTYLDGLIDLTEYNFRAKFDGEYFSQRPNKIVCVIMKLENLPKIKIVYNYQHRVVLTCYTRDKHKKRTGGPPHFVIRHL